MINLRKFNEFFSISENLNWHLENKRQLTDNVFRPGSSSFFELIKEGRNIFEKKGSIFLDVDNILFEKTDIGKFDYYKNEIVPLDLPMINDFKLNEAEYKGKDVKLEYPMRNTGTGKKYYVYVKNPDTGNVKKIYFGDVKGGLTAKVNDEEARRSFAKRHKCHLKKDKTKPGYWACRLPRYKHLVNTTYNGYW